MSRIPFTSPNDGIEAAKETQSTASQPGKITHTRPQPPMID